MLIDSMLIDSIWTKSYILKCLSLNTYILGIDEATIPRYLTASLLGAGFVQALAIKALDFFSLGINISYKYWLISVSTWVTVRSDNLSEYFTYEYDRRKKK